MAVAIPDITGEYMSASVRFETGGAQYAGYFDPPQIAPGQVANLYLFFQNTLNVPININLNIQVPQTSGFFRGGKPILKVEDSTIELQLTEAEAGLLTLPVISTEGAKDGEHVITLEPVVKKAKGKSQRVRPAKSQSKMGKMPIDNLVGLNLVGTMGATYIEESVKKAPFSLDIAGKPVSSEQAPKLKHDYHTIWVKEQMEFLDQINHELDLRKVKLKEELTVESLYVTLYSESVTRFADTGLGLRIGEAITLGKILAYCCQFFLSDPNRRNGLLVPIWERALDANVDTSNALQVIRSVGYRHILKLTVAMSFGLVAQAIGRQLWSLEERQGVAEYITENVEAGEKTEVDFVYLPLLMAGTLVSNKVRLDGEDINHSLSLMKKAHEARTELFTDEDMVQPARIYKHILNKTLQASQNNS